jgi:predicted hydrocarbon binding protein
MKSDYEKLKAFAEELNPCGVPNCSQTAYFRSPNDEGVCYYATNGNIIVIGREESISTTSAEGVVQPTRMLLDKWIDETREYWRDKGLPSLQKRTMPDLSGESFDVQRRHSDNIKGKLYEMPNTVVHLETQDEYEEYMQMCEDVGWEWYEGGKPKDLKHNTEYLYIEIKDNFCRSSQPWGENGISLQELKERIGVKTGTLFRKSLLESCVQNWQEQAEGIIYGKEKPFYNIVGHLTKTNAVKPATKIMNNIKNTAKRLLLSEPEKTYVKAGLMDIDKNWGYEALQTAKDQVLDEFMATKKFKDQMTEVAKAIIEENK